MFRTEFIYFLNLAKDLLVFCMIPVVSWLNLSLYKRIVFFLCVHTPTRVID